MTAWNINLESAVSDGATPASVRVTTTIPWGARTVRLLVYNAASRAFITSDFGLWTGALAYQIAGGVPGTTLITAEYIVPRFPPGVTFPGGLITFYAQPNVFIPVGNRALYSFNFSD